MPIICLAGALLNIVINILSTVPGGKFPLYSDTILTVTLTFIGGPFWGALCGALTNLIGHSIRFWGWAGYLFALCNIATALLTYLFIRLFPRELALSKWWKAGRFDIPGERASKSRRLESIMGRIVVLVLLSFALCLAMSILGGLIAAFIQFLNPAPPDPIHISAFLAPILFGQHVPIVVVEILSRIPVNIIDRLIAAFGGYGIALALMPLKRIFPHNS